MSEVAWTTTLFVVIISGRLITGSLQGGNEDMLLVRGVE